MKSYQVDFSFWSYFFTLGNMALSHTKNSTLLKLTSRNVGMCDMCMFKGRIYFSFYI